MAFPSAHHNHGDCVAHALSAAEAHCRVSGGRLTPVRHRVLELIWGSHRPVGAYALLEALGREGFPAAPPTVYRALDFLLAQGLVHRIERLDAFVGCSHPDRVHCGQFLLCAGCGAAAELDDPMIRDALTAGAERAGFQVARQTVEIEGLCPDCRADEEKTAS